MYRWIVALSATLAIASNSSSSQTVSPAAKAANLSVASQGSTSRPFKEDWTTIYVAKSGLPLASFGGPVLSKVEGPGFTRELVQLQWRPADPIDVYIIRPLGVAKPPAILYLYDYTSDTDRFRNDGWCGRATKNGFAAVGFVSALSGQRFHTPRLMKQWFVSELQEALATSTHDVQMVLNYMGSRGDLDMKGVGIFGEGSGGAIAILATAADPRIAAVDVVDPWGAWPEWLKGSPQIPETERALYLKPEFLQPVTGLDPVSFLPGLTQKAVRVEELLDDPITPSPAREKIMAAVSKREDLVRYEDGEAHQKAYRVNGLSGWLQNSLRPPTNTHGTVSQVPPGN